jgi:hypothetical protein
MTHSGLGFLLGTITLLLHIPGTSVDTASVGPVTSSDPKLYSPKVALSGVPSLPCNLAALLLFLLLAQHHFLQEAS